MSRRRLRGAIDPALARSLAQGTYVVDARAVAEAMLRRPSTFGVVTRDAPRPGR